MLTLQTENTQLNAKLGETGAFSVAKETKR